MGIVRIYFGFEGRIGRQTYWLAMLVLFLIAMCALTGVIAIVTGNPLSPDIWGMRPESVSIWLPIFGGYYALVLWPSLAIALKRWHDRNRPTWIYLFFVLVNLAPLLLKIAAAKGLLPDVRAQFEGPVIAAVLLLSVYPMIELGFIKGTQGSNRFGPDPLPPEAHIPGNGFWNWMFGLNGRISRSRWWLGLLVTLGVMFSGFSVAGIVVSAVLAVRFPGLVQDPAFEQKVDDPQWASSPEAMAFALTVLAVLFAVMVPVLLITWWNTLAIAVKRFHDRGLSGWLVLLLLVPLGAAIGAPFLPADVSARLHEQTGTWLWLLCAVVWLWGLLQLGILPGDSGSNRYGGDPLKRSAPAQLPSR